MNEELIRKDLHTERLGQRLELFDVIPYSTNIRVRELLEGGAADGVCVIADIQQHGRGRSGRSWSSGASGESIAMSVALPVLACQGNPAAVTLIGALAVRDAVASFGPEPDAVTIKWPNDILVRGRKVCGILTELVSIAGEFRLIMGIGVNVAQTAFPEELAAKATSLAAEGIRVTQEKLSAAILNRLEEGFEDFCRSGFESRRGEYESRLVCLNSEIEIIDPASVIRGICRGVSGSGEILIERDGEVLARSSGEVSIRGDFYGKE